MKTKPVCTVVSEDTYFEAQDQFIGWCTLCCEFTTDSVEPDAEGYRCDDCDRNTVIGAEQALLIGLITIE